ncbi:nuclear transport factor 2 family protein [Pseudonocardia ailaonensis]
MDRREKAIREWFAALTERRYDDLGEQLTDDAVMELVPFHEDEINAHTTIRYEDPLRGRHTIVELYRQSAHIFDELAFTMREFHMVEGGLSAIVEYTSKGVATPTKKEFNGRYIAVFSFEDGRIALWREYHDPTRFPEAFNAGPA